MKLVLTAKEKEKEQKHTQICADFAQCSAEYPDVKVTKIIRTVANKYDMTIPGVRRILIAKGVYKVNK